MQSIPAIPFQIPLIPKIPEPVHEAPTKKRKKGGAIQPSQVSEAPQQFFPFPY